MKQINNLLQSGVDQGHFPGANYALVDPYKILDMDSVGYRQTSPELVPNTIDTIYDCASLSKVIVTTILVMQLIDKGVITLETKLKTHLNRLKHDITVYDCMTHSSGLPADIPNAKGLRNKKDVEEYVFNVDVSYKTGDKIIYSDIGYILLGFMLEEITGLSISEQAKQNIFIPLGMKNSSYSPDPLKCAPTELREDDVFYGMLQGQVHDEKSFALQGLSGHAGLFSTVQDISLFMMSILQNDEKILSKQAVDSLFLVRETYQSSYLIQRALGWDKPTKGGTSGQYTNFEETIIHTGFTGCNMWIDRKHKLGFVMLSNGVHPKRSLNNIHSYRGKIADIILSKEEDNG